MSDETLMRRIARRLQALWHRHELQEPRLTPAMARFLATRERILARRNQEQLAREDAEFRGMTDAELAAEIARLPWSTRAVTGG
jgi:hypothetical protein